MEIVEQKTTALLALLEATAQKRGPAQEARPSGSGRGAAVAGPAFGPALPHLDGGQAGMV